MEPGHNRIIDLVNRIRSLEDLTDPVVARLRIGTNMATPLQLTNFSVSPFEFSRFLFRGLRLPPITYDSLSRRVNLYPPLSEVQMSLVHIYHKWLLQVSNKMAKFTNKSYERMRDVQLANGGPWRDSYYFTPLALREVKASYANIVLEMGHVVRHAGEEFGNEYIYEKVARWIEGSNGSVRLVIIVLITEEPLPRHSSPCSLLSDSKSTPASSPGSNPLYWGLTCEQILRIPTPALAHHIMTEDLISNSRTKIDIYYADKSYPSHRGYAEHVWHGTYSNDGCLCMDDNDQFYTSSFKLSSLLPTTGKMKDGDEELKIPIEEFDLLLPKAIKENRIKQAEFLAHTTQQDIRKARV